jgi:metal-responsive CopG/Arc/MetJ family transcriptional regulator
MKTAISLPDRVFHEADEAAKRLGISRSELYARAVEAFVDAHRGENVTEALNRVYAEQSSQVDPVLMQMQLASLPDEEW